LFYLIAEAASCQGWRSARHAEYTY